MTTSNEIDAASQGYQVVAIRDKQFDDLISMLTRIESEVQELKKQFAVLAALVGQERPKSAE